MLARLATVEAAAKAKASLVVSKLDRLSRAGIRFMVDLDREGVFYVAAYNPAINTLGCIQELAFRAVSSDPDTMQT